MERNERLIPAVHLATRKLASSTNFDAVLKDVLAICTEAVGASGGTIYLHDPTTKRLRFQHVLPEDIAEKLPFTDMPDDAGIAGQVFQSRITQISEFTHSEGDPQKKMQSATGVFVRTMITVPLVMGTEDPIGIVQLVNKSDGAFNETDSAVLDTVAAVSTMAFMNSRLIEESARASSLLGMGKVSHDIGNLAASLFAQLTFSEMSLDQLKRAFDGKRDCTLLLEPLGEIAEMHHELRNSVDRIVGYARLISDLSAGRALRPKMVCEPLAPTIRTSAAYLQTEGRNNFVKLTYDIQDGAPPVNHDQLYVFRIVQNLVGNAIKAVKEMLPDDWHAEQDSEETHGEVIVRYRHIDRQHILEVIDSGPGMSQRTIDRILAGNARSQWDKGSGSGWGTKIVLELAATLNAKVEINSEVGKGSTFRVIFPHR